MLLLQGSLALPPRTLSFLNTDVYLRLLTQTVKADYTQSRSHINNPACNYETQTPILRKTAGLLCRFVPNGNMLVSLTPRLNPVLPSVDQMTLKSWPDISFGSLFQGCCRGVSRVWICGCICQTRCCCDSRVVNHVCPLKCA